MLVDDSDGNGLGCMGRGLGPGFDGFDREWVWVKISTKVGFKGV